MAETNTKQNILMFGATGSIGAYIIEKIVASKSSFGRIAIFTSPNTIENKAKQINLLKEQGIEVIVGDITNSLDIQNAYKDISTVISAVGRNVITEQINLINFASTTASITRFFPSEFGTDIEYDSSSSTEKPHQAKLKVRAALKEIKDLEYTYIVTGPYADAQRPASFGTLPAAPELGEFDVKSKKAVLVGDGNGKISFTTPSDVGKLVVQSLLHPKESRNRALRVNSFTTTPAEILAEFEAQTSDGGGGGDKWDVTYTSFERLREFEKEAWETKNPMAPLFTLRRIWAEGGTLYEKRDNYLIDAEDTETLADTVRKAIQTQLSDVQDLYKDRKLS